MFEKFAEMKSFTSISCNSFFFFRNHPGEASQKSRLNEVEKIYGFAFDLRLQRKFDDANKLEALVDSILEKQGDWELSELNTICTHLTHISSDTFLIECIFFTMR